MAFIEFGHSFTLEFGKGRAQQLVELSEENIRELTSEVDEADEQPAKKPRLGFAPNEELDDDEEVGD